MLRKDRRQLSEVNIKSRFGQLPISALAVSIVISSFGPYIYPTLGLRLEQAVIYISFILLVITGSFSVFRTNSLLWILLCFFILLFIPLLTLYQDNYIRAELVVAQIENYLQPPIVLLIFVLALQRAPRTDNESLFSRLTTITIYMLALNTIYSIYLLGNPGSALIEVFSGSRGDMTQYNEPGMTATQLFVALGGRVTGVFGQVFEGGYAYSIGLFLWVYNYKGTGKSVLLSYSLLLMILVGGALTFSKVFLIGGLPLFLLSFGIKRVLSLSVVLVTFMLIAMQLYPLLTEELGELRGIWGITRLLNVNFSDFASVYTSGRFSAESIILPSIFKILTTSPFIGLGYGSLETSDFSLYEVISLGGLIGLTSYLILHILMIGLAFSLKRGRDRILYLNFLAITFLTALAAPTITANRVSVLIWLIVAWALCEAHQKQKRILGKI